MKFENKLLNIVRILLVVVVLFSAFMFFTMGDTQQGIFPDGSTAQKIWDGFFLFTEIFTISLVILAFTWAVLETRKELKKSKA